MNEIDFQRVKLFKSDYLTNIISKYFENLAIDEKGTIFLVSPSLETFNTKGKNFFKEIWIDLYSRNSNFINKQLKTYILIPLLAKNRRKPEWLDFEPIIQSIDYVNLNSNDSDLRQRFMNLSNNLSFFHYECDDDYSFGLYLKGIIIENDEFKDLPTLTKKLKSLDRKEIFMILGSSVGAPFGKLVPNSDNSGSTFKYDYIIKYDEETEKLVGDHCLVKYHQNKLATCLLNNSVISKNDAEKLIDQTIRSSISLSQSKLFNYEDFYLRCSFYNLITENVTDSKAITSIVNDTLKNLKDIRYDKQI
jgi:hypothetical protein